MCPQIAPKLRADYTVTVASNWEYWIPAQIINFRYVAPVYQVRWCGRCAPRSRRQPAFHAGMSLLTGVSTMQLVSPVANISFPYCLTFAVAQALVWRYFTTMSEVCTIPSGMDARYCGRKNDQCELINRARTCSSTISP